ncbi:MAG TPA: hypothetical protein VKY81_04715 [Natronosporangium sp.]|nr:hypothetical protein [Natronosporangium sp.]
MSGRAVLLAAGEGVAALAIGTVAGGMLFGNVLGLFGGVLDRHPSYAMAVAAGAVAAAAAGLVAGAVLVPVDVLIPAALYDLHEVMIGACAGLALGGALLAAAAAPAAGRVAIVAGLATGLPTFQGLLAVTEMLTPVGSVVARRRRGRGGRRGGAGRPRRPVGAVGTPSGCWRRRRRCGCAPADRPRPATTSCWRRGSASRSVPA